jgi:hypothetical protein
MLGVGKLFGVANASLKPLLVGELYCQECLIPNF